MIHLVIVALGGAIGASARHLAGLAALRLFGPGFPWGTFFVNVLGSFLDGRRYRLSCETVWRCPRMAYCFLRLACWVASPPFPLFRSMPSCYGSAVR